MQDEKINKCILSLIHLYLIHDKKATRDVSGNDCIAGVDLSN
jgi:hypothetical protein